MKNPWMSLWLSAAGKAASATRGRAMAEFQQGQRRMIETFAALFFAPELKPVPVKRRRSRHIGR